MKKKPLFSTELCWLLGMLLLALGAQLQVLADFGVSTIVAIPYLLSVKLEPICSFFTFGMSQYVFQTVLLIAMMLITQSAKGKAFLSRITDPIKNFVKNRASRASEKGAEKV